MTNWREDTLPDFSKYSSEWKNVATYYNQLVGKYIVDFLVDNPVIGQYYRNILTNKLNTDFITLNGMVKQLDELSVLTKDIVNNSEFLQEIDAPYLYKKRPLASSFVDYIDKNYPERFRDYKEEFSSKWQIEWYSSLGEMQKNLFRIQLGELPQNALFLIGVYVSDFELLHQLFFKPFFKSVIDPNIDSYRERLNWFIRCLGLTHSEDELKFALSDIITEVFDPDLRNCIVKHSYSLDRENNIIKYFNPDPLTRRYKEKGFIKVEDLIRRIITQKIILWIFLSESTQTNGGQELLLAGIIKCPQSLNDIFPLILASESVKILQTFVKTFRSFSKGIVNFTESNFGEEILKHQLIESWLSFRLIILYYIPKDQVPNRDSLTHFSRIEIDILTNMLFKVAYLLFYEEMMQTVIHPIGKIVSKRTSKRNSLGILADLDDQKFKPLFEGMNTDLRDSLAHSSYYYNQEGEEWIYLKFGKEVHRNRTLLALDLFLNYHDTISAIFPNLTDIPPELTTAQLINEITNKDNINSPEFWERREVYIRENKIIYWFPVCLLKQALSHANSDNNEKASRILSLLREPSEMLSSISLDFYETLIGWSLSYYENQKTWVVTKSLAHRLLKKIRSVNYNPEIEYRCVLVLLFFAFARKDDNQRRKLEKELTKIHKVKNF